MLGVCYDIRHALMGDREILFVDNGMDTEKMKRMGMIDLNRKIPVIRHLSSKYALKKRITTKDGET